MLLQMETEEDAGKHLRCPAAMVNRSGLILPELQLLSMGRPVKRASR